MTESKTSATAIVTMTVSVELNQPWGGECTLAQVQQQARRDAQEQLEQLRQHWATRGVRIGEVRSIRIVLNEEKT